MGPEPSAFPARGLACLLATTSGTNSSYIT